MRWPLEFPSSSWTPCCWVLWLLPVTPIAWNSWPASRLFDCSSVASAVVSFVASVVLSGRELALSLASALLREKGRRPGAVARFGAVVAASRQSCPAEQTVAFPGETASVLVHGMSIVKPAETFAPADAGFVPEGDKSVPVDGRWVLGRSSGRSSEQLPPGINQPSSAFSLCFS